MQESFTSWPQGTNFSSRAERRRDRHVARRVVEMLMERDTDASERVSASVPGKVELATHDTKVCSLQAIIAVSYTHLRAHETDS